MVVKELLEIESKIKDVEKRLKDLECLILR
jgi:hypothetical protein